MTEQTYTITKALRKRLIENREPGQVRDLLRSLTPNTVEPVAEVVVQESGRFTINVHIQKPENQFSLSAGTHQLYMHPAPSTKPAPASGERDVLIAELRRSADILENDGADGWLVNELRKAADMLAADAQLEAERDGERKSRCEAWAKSEEAWRLVQSLQAQQVAVPQGWKLVPLVATELMRELVVQSFYDELLAAAPQPPQTVPMTPKEIDEAYMASPFCNVRSGIFAAGVRFAEAHHGITK